MNVQTQTPSTEKPQGAFESYQDNLRKRKREAIRIVTRAIPDADRRLAPYYNEERAQIRWAQFKLYEWNDDERRTLLWLKGMLSGRLSIPSRDPMDLFPMNFEMKEAIFCALAQLTFSSHVINKHYRKSYEGEQPGAAAETNP